MNPAPPPIVEVAIEPKSQADRERLCVALAKLTAEDSSFMVSEDRESGQTILRGASEEHLATKLRILERAYGVRVDIGAPQAAHRERLKMRAEVDYTHKKRTGGSSQFARVRIVIAPNEPGVGNSFASKIAGGAMPEEFVSGIKKGIQSVMDAGILAGFPVVDMKATLVDSGFHDADSTALAFEIASRAATREGLQKGGSELLEPIMNVEVKTVKEYAGSIIPDLRSRCARGVRQDSRGDAVVIRAAVPLANMFGYASQLRSLSQGSASHTMEFSHYAPVPPPDNRPFPAGMAMRRA